MTAVHQHAVQRQRLVHHRRRRVQLAAPARSPFRGPSASGARSRAARSRARPCAGRSAAAACCRRGRRRGRPGCAPRRCRPPRPAGSASASTALPQPTISWLIIFAARPAPTGPMCVKRAATSFHSGARRSMSAVAAGHDGQRAVRGAGGPPETGASIQPVFRRDANFFRGLSTLMVEKSTRTRRLDRARHALRPEHGLLHRLGGRQVEQHCVDSGASPAGNPPPSRRPTARRAFPGTMS